MAEDLKKNSLKAEDLPLYRKIWQVCHNGSKYGIGDMNIKQFFESLKEGSEMVKGYY